MKTMEVGLVTKEAFSVKAASTMQRGELMIFKDSKGKAVFMCNIRDLLYVMDSNKVTLIKC